MRPLGTMELRMLAPNSIVRNRRRPAEQPTALTPARGPYSTRRPSGRLSLNRQEQRRIRTYVEGLPSWSRPQGLVRGHGETNSAQSFLVRSTFNTRPLAATQQTAVVAH